MKNRDEGQEYGCKLCWPTDAREAKEARKQVEDREWIVDESHFTVYHGTCKHCGQLYLMVFAETVDWYDGNDPQAFSRMPATVEEIAELRSLPSEVEVELRLRTLGRDRLSMNDYWPSTGERHYFWSRGLWIGAHE